MVLIWSAAPPSLAQFRAPRTGPKARCRAAPNPALWLAAAKFELRAILAPLENASINAHVISRQAAPAREQITAVIFIGAGYQ